MYPKEDREWALYVLEEGRVFSRAFKLRGELARCDAILHPRRTLKGPGSS